MTTRRGAALVWALVVLAATSAGSAAVTVRLVADRRAAVAREHAAQAEWLARGGCELAAAKLRANPSYAGETARPLPNGEVVVTVTRDGGRVRVSAEARFPTDAPAPAVGNATRDVAAE